MVKIPYNYTSSEAEGDLVGTFWVAKLPLGRNAAKKRYKFCKEEISGDVLVLKPASF